MGHEPDHAENDEASKETSEAVAERNYHCIPEKYKIIIGLVQNIYKAKNGSAALAKFILIQKFDLL